MKFLVDYTGHAEDRLLSYLDDEYSLFVEPFEQRNNFVLALNMLNLTVTVNLQNNQLHMYER